MVVLNNEFSYIYIYINIMKSRHVEKVKLKILKVMKLNFKTRYSHLLLNISFDDKFWGSHLRILHLNTYTTMEVTMGKKKHNLNNILLLLLGLWPKNYSFGVLEHFFWSILPCLHSGIEFNRPIINVLWCLRSVPVV